MANVKDIVPEELDRLAWEYIQFCLDATIEVPTAKGACKIKQRHLPTISFFLLVWCRDKAFEFYGRANWYIVLRDEEHPYHIHVNAVNELFNALAVDIVANEGKGIFFAKNKLGMSDRIDQRNENTITTLNVNVNRSGLPAVKSEKDVNLS